MIVWGSKGELKDLGAQRTQMCPTCERERTFKLMLQYKVHHVWYLFKWVSGKKYLLACDVCHRGTVLNTKEVEASLKQHPIPWMSRFGWTLLIALIVGVGAIGSMEGEQRQSQMTELMRTPQPNDLYVVNMAKLLKNPEATYMYGVMRVKSVQGNQVAFDMPNVSYNKAKGATKDIQNGKIASGDYFAPQPLLLSNLDVASLKADGAIYSVERR